jgi:23S rRNA pseudouridine1911/1915/1917 synthase
LTIEAELLLLDDDAVGTRLDSFLASRIEAISRTRLQRAIEDGDVLVNNRIVKASYRLRAADQIEIDLPEPGPVEILAEPIPLKIVYEDSDLVVVDKPAGIVVHPGAGIESGTLANALVFHFNELSGVAGRIRPGIVHRIDRETSGLLVVAKNDQAHEKLSDQFRDRSIFKMYVALVYGQMSRERGEVEANIGRSPNNRTRMAVLKGGAGRPARTLFQVDKRFQELTLLSVEIKSGRTHQIRVHLSHIGYPVVGDIAYGQGRENTVQDVMTRQGIKSLGRHFLHSSRLAFEHPTSHERMEFSSPLPPELESMLEGLK